MICAGFHVDSNFIVLEQTDGGLRRAQLAQTLSVSHPLGRFTIAGGIGILLAIPPQQRRVHALGGIGVRCVETSSWMRDSITG
jgi:hypothetical protein